MVLGRRSFQVGLDTPTPPEHLRNPESEEAGLELGAGSFEIELEILEPREPEPKEETMVMRDSSFEIYLDDI